MSWEMLQELENAQCQLTKNKRNSQSKNID